MSLLRPRIGKELPHWLVDRGAHKMTLIVAVVGGVPGVSLTDTLI